MGTLGMLLAYDSAGNVIATLDLLIQHDAEGNALGVVDFAAHEEAGAEHLDLWVVDGAVGSKVWPEWLGSAALDFRVERDGPPGARPIITLVHRTSGHRRARAGIEGEIAHRIDSSAGDPADIRDLVGGPGRPLQLDGEGKTLPLVSAGQEHPSAVSLTASILVKGK